MNIGSLTVLFEDPFWIGVFEITDHEGLRVCKVTFGAEPTEKEVMEFIDKNWNRLQFSQAVDVAPVAEIRKKSKETTSRGQKTDAVTRHRNQVAAGLEIETGTEQDGAETAFEGRTRSGKATPV